MSWSLSFHGGIKSVDFAGAAWSATCVDKVDFQFVTVANVVNEIFDIPLVGEDAFLEIFRLVVEVTEGREVKKGEVWAGISGGLGVHDTVTADGAVDIHGPFPFGRVEAGNVRVVYHSCGDG